MIQVLYKMIRLWFEDVVRYFQSLFSEVQFVENTSELESKTQWLPQSAKGPFFGIQQTR
jgi:hypothetical protein